MDNIGSFYLWPATDNDKYLALNKQRTGDKIFALLFCSWINFFNFHKPGLLYLLYDKTPLSSMFIIWLGLLLFGVTYVLLDKSLQKNNKAFLHDFCNYLQKQHVAVNFILDKEHQTRSFFHCEQGTKQEVLSHSLDF